MLESSSGKQIIRPFLKWVGGKRWLVHKHPYVFTNNFKRYIEPFLGGGSVFFYLKPKKAILGDTNQDLIDTYEAIRDNWTRVITILKVHHKKHSEAYYYRQRKIKPTSKIKKAAWFIYLNRTCFNGIYRVNLKGKFNVPKGSKHTVISPNDDFKATSIALQKCKLMKGDFSKLIKKAKKGDLLYVDPPYTVQHNSNNFVKYNESIFKWADQERLAEDLYKAKARGASIIMSNANHRSIRKLYKDFGAITRIQRNSILAADSNYRGRSTELIITNIEITM